MGCDGKCRHRNLSPRCCGRAASRSRESRAETVYATASGGTRMGDGILATYRSSTSSSSAARPRMMTGQPPPHGHTLGTSVLDVDSTQIDQPRGSSRRRCDLRQQPFRGRPVAALDRGERKRAGRITCLHHRSGRAGAGTKRDRSERQDGKPLHLCSPQPGAIAENITGT